MIVGSSARDVISALGGNDVVYPTAGDDITRGSGLDRADGGVGDGAVDSCDGGDGADTTVATCETVIGVP